MLFGLIQDMPNWDSIILSIDDHPDALTPPLGLYMHSRRSNLVPPGRGERTGDLTPNGAQCLGQVCADDVNRKRVNALLQLFPFPILTDVQCRELSEMLATRGFADHDLEG
jgi:hypothetical protein